MAGRNERESKGRWYGLLGLVALVFVFAGILVFSYLGKTTERNARPVIGRSAPVFSLDSLAKESVNLSDFKGQVVLINFWASWCMPCRTEMLDLQTAYEAYRDQGFVILAIDVGEPQRMAAAFAQEFGLTFPVLLDSNSRIAQRYGVRALPSSFFVDQEGILRDIVIGGPMNQDYIESKIKPLLESREKEASLSEGVTGKQEDD